MIERPYYVKLFIAIVQKCTPHLSSLLTFLSMTGLLSVVETYLAILQGKGAGSGWDLQAEITVAASIIKRSNAIIFDVGANKGEWSFGLFQQLNTSQTKFFLFEPAPSCQYHLHNLNLPTAIYIDAAVGNKIKDATLYSPTPNSPLASLYERGDSFLRSTDFSSESVNITTIDHIVNKFKVDMIDFIKLDIEGSEIAALHGASSTLVARQIKALSFEFGSANINSRTYFRDFWDLLVPLGYKIKRIAPGGDLINIDEYDETLEYFRGATNYVAILQ